MFTLAAGRKRAMTITIDLLPEETERLAAEARGQGLSLEEYIHGRLVPDKPARKRKITDLEGLGKELWQGVDVQKYLDELRDDRDYSEIHSFDRE